MFTWQENKFLACDAPRPWGVYFQDTASPQMEALVELHDNIMFYLVIILLGVAWIMSSIIRNYVKNRISNKYLNHGTLIELIWTITPALILILIAFPLFKLFYLMDEVTDPSLTVFAEGHQWYWSYQYPDFLSDDNGEVFAMHDDPRLTQKAVINKPWYESSNYGKNKIVDLVHVELRKGLTGLDPYHDAHTLEQDQVFIIDRNDASGQSVRKLITEGIDFQTYFDTNSGPKSRWYGVLVEKQFVTEHDGDKWLQVYESSWKEITQEKDIHSKGYPIRKINSLIAVKKD